MTVSKEELIHIANLADLIISEDELDKYLADFEEMLNFVNIVCEAPLDDLDITIGANEANNIFRKDEVKAFEDSEALLQNSINPEQNMFKIPKVLN